MDSPYNLKWRQVSYLDLKVGNINHIYSYNNYYRVYVNYKGCLNNMKNNFYNIISKYK